MAQEMIKPDVQKNIVEAAYAKLDLADGKDKNDKFEKKDGKTEDLNLKEIKNINEFLSKLEDGADKDVAMKALREAAKEVGDKNTPPLPDFFIMSWIMSESQDVAKGDLVIQLKTAIGSDTLDEKSKKLVTYDNGLLDRVMKYVVAGNDKATITDVQVKLNAFRDIALEKNDKYKPADLWSDSELKGIKDSLSDESLKGFLQDGKLKEDGLFGIRTLKFLEIYTNAMKNMGTEKPKVDALESSKEDLAKTTGEVLAKPEEHAPDGLNKEQSDTLVKQVNELVTKGMDSVTANTQLKYSETKVTQDQLDSLNKHLGLEGDAKLTPESTWAQIGDKSYQVLGKALAPEGAKAVSGHTIVKGTDGKDRVCFYLQLPVDVQSKEHNYAGDVRITTTMDLSGAQTSTVDQFLEQQFALMVKDGKGDMKFVPMNGAKMNWTDTLKGLGVDGAENLSKLEGSKKAALMKALADRLQNSEYVQGTLLVANATKVGETSDLKGDHKNDSGEKNNDSKGEKEGHYTELFKDFVNDPTGKTDKFKAIVGDEVEVHGEHIKWCKEHNDNKDGTRYAQFMFDWEGASASAKGGKDALVTLEYNKDGKVTAKIDAYGLKMMNDWNNDPKVKTALKDYNDMRNKYGNAAKEANNLAASTLYKKAEVSKLLDIAKALGCDDQKVMTSKDGGDVDHWIREEYIDNDKIGGTDKKGNSFGTVTLTNPTKQDFEDAHFAHQLWYNWG